MSSKEIFTIAVGIATLLIEIYVLFYIFKDLFISPRNDKRFINAIKIRLNAQNDLSAKQFFDVATGCGINRALAVKRLKSLLTDGSEIKSFEKLHALIDLVEDYAPIQTSKAGFLANLLAVENSINNQADKNVSLHFIAVKNEISSLSEKLSEYEQSKWFNKFVGWLSIVGLILATWFSINSPSSVEIAADIFKIQNAVQAAKDVVK
jgi:hypothetical protein